jgi:hypothetical protein
MTHIPRKSEFIRRRPLFFLLIYETSYDRQVARAISDRNADEQAMEG